MNDIQLLDSIEEVARELFRRHGVNGKEVTISITQNKAVVKDAHGNTVEEVEL